MRDEKLDTALTKHGVGGKIRRVNGKKILLQREIEKLMALSNFSQ